MTALVGGVLRGFGEGVQKLYPPDTPPPELPHISSLSDVSRSGARTLEQPALCAYCSLDALAAASPRQLYPATHAVAPRCGGQVGPFTSALLAWLEQRRQEARLALEQLRQETAEQQASLEELTRRAEKAEGAISPFPPLSPPIRPPFPRSSVTPISPRSPPDLPAGERDNLQQTNAQLQAPLVRASGTSNHTLGSSRPSSPGAGAARREPGEQWRGAGRAADGAAAA